MAKVKDETWSPNLQPLFPAGQNQAIVHNWMGELFAG